MNRNILILAFLILTPALAVHAQWLRYPTAGAPRLPNGALDLTAAAPKTSDGRPDLSGLWLANPERGTGVSFAGAPLPALFRNIGAQLKDGLPYRPWARDLTNARQADNLKDSPDGQCLPLSILWLQSHLFPSKIVQTPGLIVVLYEKGVDYRQIFTDGRPLPRRSATVVFRLLVRKVGARHAGCPNKRLPRRSVGRPQRQPDHGIGEDHRAIQAPELRQPRNRSHRRRSQSLHGAVDRHDQPAPDG